MEQLLSNRSLRGVIFDCYGVIVRNSRVKALESLNPEARLLFDKISDEANRGLHTESRVLELHSEILGITPGALELQLAESEVAIVEVLNAALRLREQGFIVGLLSNISSRERVEKRLHATFKDDLKLEDFFQQAFFSCELGVAKPALESYKLALEGLGLKAEETVFVDDNLGYIQGARRAGLQTVHFTNVETGLAELESLTQTRCF